MDPVPRLPSGHALPRELLLRRSLAVFVALLFVVGGPFARQVLEWPDRHLSRWIMFRSVGLTLIDARFYRREPGGQLVRAERPSRPGASVVGPGQPERLTTYEELEAAARDLCVSLGPEADVRVVSRVATPQGWLQQLAREENLCVALARRDVPLTGSGAQGGLDGRQRKLP